MSEREARHGLAGARLLQIEDVSVRFGALLATTAGVLSAISACNAPLIGNVARISVPFFAFAIAAVLYVPNHRASAAVFVIAVAVLEYDLTRDAMWENSGF